MAEVVSVKQSPLNAKQWNVSLQCGHDVWTTCVRRPTRRRMKCQKCEGGKPWKSRAR